MAIWEPNDPTGPLRALNILDQLARLVLHGHKAEAIGKIAGAVAVGFVEAKTVEKELKIGADELSVAVEFYKQAHPGKLAPKALDAADILFKQISKAGGLAGGNNPGGLPARWCRR